MLWPVLMPVCLPTATSPADSIAPFASALVGVGIHTLAMVGTTVVVAALVYGWLGVAILRSAWLNVDIVWMLALVATGALLLFA